MQISGSQILIFGGLVPKDEQASDTTFDVQDNKVNLTITAQSIILDVTVGSIKYGPDLATPTYFVSGGNMMPTQSQIYCLGMILPQTEKQPFEVGSAAHKKLIHSYNVADQKWTEANESIFAAGNQRHDSDDD